MDRKFYILQQFISETLSEEEKIEFQEYMLNDKDFRRKLIKAAEIDSRLDEWLKKDSGENNELLDIPFFKNPAFYKPALLVAAVLSIGLIILSLFRPVNYEKMYKSEYQAMILEEFRSLSGSGHNNVIVEYYQDENYEAIYELIAGDQEMPELNDLSAILAGIASMEVGNFILAEALFKRIYNESEYRPVAAWYLALINLKQKNIEMVLQYLDEAEESILYMEGAGELRERILREVRPGSNR